MDQALKQEDIPSGGIADFIYSDEEIKLLEEKELQDLYGENGIAQFKAIGKEMANFGRYGDDTVAHVETGELIVPRALIENNPKLKESIFGHLRELGVEDPERYVVGTSKNSLNPDTGLPEFFLKGLFKGVKKAVSGVAKGVKSALKGVGKALKKVAPIVLPIALAMTPLGPIYGAALGSGIGTLVQGGSVEDAFKSALIAGASGAVYSGVSSALTPGGSFTGGISEAFANPGARFSQTLANPLSSYQPTATSQLVKSDTLYDGTKTESMLPRGENLSVKSKVDFDAPPEAYGFKTGDKAYNTEQLKKIMNRLDKMTKLREEGITLTGEGLKGVPQVKMRPTDLMQQQPSFFEKGIMDLKDYGARASDFIFGPDDVTPLEILKKEYPDLTFEQLKGIDEDSAIYLDAVEKAANASPGFLRRYGPSTALGIAGLSAAGAFDTPKDEPLPPLETGFDIYRRDPGKYNVGDIDSRRAQGPFVTDTSYGFDYNPYVFPTQPFQTVAEGGEIFPRRNGGISPREGTPGKDSVRAMLMPGEFVMTTDAVKGLGGGNLDRGIKNMYSVMSKLEKRGKAMA